MLLQTYPPTTVFQLGFPAVYLDNIPKSCTYTLSMEMMTDVDIYLPVGSRPKLIPMSNCCLGKFVNTIQ